MPRNPSPAQIEASRRNGRRSHGPITPAGKAHAALNARTWGLRSVDYFPTGDEDVERFNQLQNSIQDEFRPSSPLEAALCARMVAALWRSERAERLEGNYWAFPPVDCPDTSMARIDILGHDVRHHRPTLDTIMRYLSQAQQAYNRAFRQLQLLREGRADPAEDALFVTSDLPGPLHDGLKMQAAEDQKDDEGGPPPMDASAPMDERTDAPEPPAEDAVDQAAPVPPPRPAMPTSAPSVSRLPAANDATPTLTEICTNEPEIARQWLWKEMQAWMASR
jgi:hypothetical protein